MPSSFRSAAGGLCAGVASAVSCLRLVAKVFGVEPEGADSMHRSFAAKRAAVDRARRDIADSLERRTPLPFSFELCRRNVDRLVLVSDRSCEQRCACYCERRSSPSSRRAPPRPRCVNSDRYAHAAASVAIIVCGSNIDAQSYAQLIQTSPNDRRFNLRSRRESAYRSAFTPDQGKNCAAIPRRSACSIRV